MTEREKKKDKLFFSIPACDVTFLSSPLYQPQSTCTIQFSSFFVRVVWCACAHVSVRQLGCVFGFWLSCTIFTQCPYSRIMWCSPLLRNLGQQEFNCCQDLYNLTKAIRLFYWFSNDNTNSRGTYLKVPRRAVVLAVAAAAAAVLSNKQGVYEVTIRANKITFAKR